ncbi:MAG: S41 family peptidase [Bacillota bacterium]
MSIKKIGLVALVVVITNALTFFVATNIIETEETYPANEINEDLRVFQEIISILEAEHLEEVDRQELLEGGYQGILDNLDDPQASYLTPEEYENLMVETEGTYGGVGIEVTMEDDYVTIISPISGGPAKEVGLSANDRILSVDGENLVGESLNKAVELMRGKPGTELELEVERPGVEDTLEFEVTREQIELDTVEFEMLEAGIGYIELSNFADTSAEEFEEALSKLEEDGMEALLIDLRNNPGGILNAAVEIAEMLMPEGPVTHVISQDQKIKTYESGTEGLDIPMAVLVNETSSSASEVLAGALQDTDTATIIGTSTYGKASVQNVRALSNEGALRYTVAQYETPDGRVIHEEGLDPDLEVDPPEAAELAMMPISTEMAEGDEGEEVETLQKILKEFGYYEAAVTGNFDSATASALEEFQEALEIPATGEMSDMTVRRMHEEIEKLIEENDRQLERALELLENELE